MINQVFSTAQQLSAYFVVKNITKSLPGPINTVLMCYLNNSNCGHAQVAWLGAVLWVHLPLARLQAHLLGNDAALNLTCTATHHGVFCFAKVALHVLFRQLCISAQGLHTVE